MSTTKTPRKNNSTSSVIRPIKELTSDQREQVFQLLLRSQYYQRGELDHAIIKDKVLFENDWREVFERYQQDDDVELFISLIDDVPVGYMCVRLFKNGAFIDDVFVDELYRKQGIARQLMTDTLRWAQTRSVETIHLSVARANPAAIALYKHLGFKQQPSEYLDFTLKTGDQDE